MNLTLLVLYLAIAGLAYGEYLWIVPVETTRKSMVERRLSAALVAVLWPLCLLVLGIAIIAMIVVMSRNEPFDDSDGFGL